MTDCFTVSGQKFFFFKYHELMACSIFKIIENKS